MPSFIFSNLLSRVQGFRRFPTNKYLYIYDPVDTRVDKIDYANHWRGWESNLSGVYSVGEN